MFFTAPSNYGQQMRVDQVNSWSCILLGLPIHVSSLRSFVAYVASDWSAKKLYEGWTWTSPDWFCNSAKRTVESCCFACLECLWQSNCWFISKSAAVHMASHHVKKYISFMYPNWWRILTIGNNQWIIMVLLIGGRNYIARRRQYIPGILAVYTVTWVIIPLLPPFPSTWKIFKQLTNVMTFNPSYPFLRPFI